MRLGSIRNGIRLYGNQIGILHADEATIKKITKDLACIGIQYKTSEELLYCTKCGCLSRQKCLVDKISDKLLNVIAIFIHSELESTAVDDIISENGANPGIEYNIVPMANLVHYSRQNRKNPVYNGFIRNLRSSEMQFKEFSGTYDCIQNRSCLEKSQLVSEFEFNPSQEGIRPRTSRDQKKGISTIVLDNINDMHSFAGLVTDFNREDSNPRKKG